MHLGCCETFGKRKNHSPASRVFSPFLSQHPVCMHHAILHGKPFGIAYAPEKDYQRIIQYGKKASTIRCFFPEWKAVLTSLHARRKTMISFVLPENSKVKFMQIRRNLFKNTHSETRNMIGSDNPARKIEIHCSYFIKQLPNGFPCRIA